MPLRAIYKPEPLWQRWGRRLLPYGAAVVSSGAAFGLTSLLPALSEKPFFLFLFAGTAVCAWGFGIASGLTSIGLNVLAIDYFGLNPTGSLRVSDSNDLIRLLVFAAASTVLAWTMAHLRSVHRQLQLAHERFELAHEIGKIWAWELDLPTGKVIWSSRAKDRREHDLPFQVWFERVHPDDRDRVTFALERAVQSKQPYEIEFRVMTERGARWIASSGEFHRGVKNEQRIFGVSVDITLRKQAETALEAAARGEMAGELAHKLNNPLQGLVHALYLLHQQTHESDVLQYATVAQSEAQRVSSLVKQLLQLYSARTL